MKQLRWVDYTFSILALAFLALALDATRAHASVSISAFNAAPQTTTILVKWTTASELNNAGFNLYRSTRRPALFKDQFLSNTSEKPRRDHWVVLYLFRQHGAQGEDILL
jgi:hypothetical protein